MVNKKYDVIVIGAGLAGLAASLKLVQNKLSVLVLEQNNQVGGYAVNFTRKNFRIEGALQSVTGCRPDGAFYKILQMIDFHEKVEFIEIPQLKNQIDLQSRSSFVYMDDYNNFIEGMRFKYPKEIKSLRKFLRRGIGMAKFLGNWNISSFGKKNLLILRNLHRLPRLFYNFRRSAEDLLNRHFKDEELKKELYSYANYLGADDEDLSAIVFFASIFTKFTQDDFYMKGGSGSFTQSLAQEITKLGGTIVTQAKVTGLNYNQHVIESIEVTSKKREDSPVIIPADKILFCADPEYMLSTLWKGPPLPQKYIYSLKKRIQTESIFEVYLGLDIDLRNLGFGEYCYEIQDSNGIRCKMFVYSNLDPSCAPKGCSNIEIIHFMRADLFNLAICADNGHRGKNYSRLKDQITTIFVNIVAKLVGLDDFHDHIMYQDAATPITFERYTNNTRGSFAGYTATFGQTIINPVSITTPVKNLFLAGQWINLGGGFQMTIYGGIKAAEIISRTAKKKWKGTKEILYK